MSHCHHKFMDSIGDSDCQEPLVNKPSAKPFTLTAFDSDGEPIMFLIVTVIGSSLDKETLQCRSYPFHWSFCRTGRAGIVAGTSSRRRQDCATHSGFSEGCGTSRMPTHDLARPLLNQLYDHPTLVSSRPTMKTLCLCLCAITTLSELAHSAPANGFSFPDSRREKKLEPIITPPVLPILEHLERDPSTLLPNETGPGFRNFGGSRRPVKPRFGGGFSVEPSGTGGLTASVSSSGSVGGASHSASQSFSFGFNNGFSGSQSASQAASFSGGFGK